jgi:8-oxo-dGTP diphosphatase
MTLEDSAKIPLVGVGVAVVKNGMVLLGKRKKTHGSGHWGFPGGHLEFGESVEACAQRELSEETGLKALSVRLGSWTSDLIEPAKHYITILTFVDHFEGEPKLVEPHKCEGWEWFSWEELPRPLFTPIESFIKKIGIDQLKKPFSLQDP